MLDSLKAEISLHKLVLGDYPVNDLLGFGERTSIVD